MSLYLAIFRSDDDDTEIDGFELGGYDDFAAFREAVHRHLEDGEWGCRYPILMNHEDARGVWTADEASALEGELLDIREAFRQLQAPDADGQTTISLHESFVDVDGAPLLDRLIDLARLSRSEIAPIWFQ
jgi:hypothetical protein